MSTSYHIGIYKETSWRIQPDVFICALQNAWQGTKIAAIENPQRPYLLEWTISLEREPGSSRLVLHGFLDRELQGIVLYGVSLEECAKFAFWFQGLYPEMNDLLFFDEQFSFDVDLYGRTETEILKLIRDGYSFTRTLGVGNEQNQAAKDNIL